LKQDVRGTKSEAMRTPHLDVISAWLVAAALIGLISLSVILPGTTDPEIRPVDDVGTPRARVVLREAPRPAAEHDASLPDAVDDPLPGDAIGLPDVQPAAGVAVRPQLCQDPCRTNFGG
jgi:hypothetical protein